MGLLFNNWLDEGYYEEDGMGDLTHITDIKDILKAQQKGSLYHNDGMGTTKVGENDTITIKNKGNNE